METAIERTLSDVLRTPLPVLHEAERRDILITRRGQAGNMILMDAKRARALRETLGTVARLLNAAVRVKGVQGQLTADVNLALPWTSYLPPEERAQFVAELAEKAGASAETGNYAPLAMLLRDWQTTALVYADPAAFTELTEPLEETELPSLLPERAGRGSRPTRATATRASTTRKATPKKTAAKRAATAKKATRKRTSAKTEAAAAPPTTPQTAAEAETQTGAEVEITVARMTERA
jgi:hypothetical protein